MRLQRRLRLAPFIAVGYCSDTWVRAGCIGRPVCPGGAQTRPAPYSEVVRLLFVTGRAARRVCAGGMALVLAVCCSCSRNSYRPKFVLGNNSAFCSSESGSSSGLKFKLSQINNSFSAMTTLKPLASIGNGRIAAILPTTSTASHFGKFDGPYLKESFQKVGLKASQYTVWNVPASEQYRAAKAAINHGASVLIVDARYSGAGVQIESYARARCVPVIDYDWLTLGGTRNYYVGFDSLKIGVLLGQGLVDCVSAWGVKKPHVLVMKGAPIDYNSALYAQGYEAILNRQFHDTQSGWKDVGNPAPGTWVPLTALRQFQHYTAHRHTNAALIPNDENGAPIIHYLQGKPLKTKAKTFPTTGLDATLTGLQNILAEYQCGTVYKPIFLEAQAAAALAVYVRAGVAPPHTLLTWPLTDPQTHTSVPSVQLTPEWVTTKNLTSTVIADHFVMITQLCSGIYATACIDAGIWPFLPVLPAVPDH
jgi:D-xylose transport system substrate-binding protein